MFVVCGEALFDLFGGGEATKLTFDARIGGSPFNVAVGIARLGQPSALFAGISTDPLGNRLVGALAAESVDCTLVKRVMNPTTLSVVSLSPDGQPHYSFYGEGAADRCLRVNDLPTLGPEVWGVHAGSYALVVEPVASAILALFEREKGRRLLTLDPNVRLTAEPDTGVWRARVERLAGLADVIKVSDEDIARLFPMATGQEIAERWLAAGAAIVFVTRGASGVELYRRTGRIAVAGRKIDVVDTVGAGDTFQAALIVGLAENGIRSRSDLFAAPDETLRAIAEFAVEAAAITCTRRGADLPARHEMAEKIEETS